MTPNEADDGVLDPEDLVLDAEHVDRLDDNRFLVRPDGDGASGGPDRLGAAEAGPQPDAIDPSDGSSAHPTPITGADEPAGATADDPAATLAADPAPHGVAMALKTDGEVATHRGTSHDVREVFADMLAWYANQLDDDLSPTEALEVLLATTDLDERA